MRFDKQLTDETHRHLFRCAFGQLKKHLFKLVVDHLGGSSDGTIDLSFFLVGEHRALASLLSPGDTDSDRGAPSTVDFDLGMTRYLRLCPGTE
ncbi:MAG TPA: hypothetical protein VIJ85_02525 [Rhizomicrobium sp.]